MGAFERRYLFTGRLMLRTALHIGGWSSTLAASDDPIVRTPEGHPFIPGSSFKGAFRSTVEKLASAILNVRTCALIDGEGDNCPGAPGKAQETFHRRRREERWDEAVLVRELDRSLCDTCKLFGSPFAAAKVRFADLYLSRDEEPITQVRDGVGIDRDSERAVDQIKFDFEVVEAGTCFDVELTLDDPSLTDLGLTCLGLSEYMAGFGGLGGKRSRGLGSCQLTELRVYELDLTDERTRAQRLREYLLGRDGGRELSALTPAERMTLLPDVDAFIRQHVEDLLRERST
jgi:CRISPR-associated RAMP protein (TIGR02581 family)